MQQARMNAMKGLSPPSMSEDAQVLAIALKPVR
jgi:hypothetical protein